MPWADEQEREILHSLGEQRLLEAHGKKQLRDAYMQKTLDPLVKGESTGGDQPTAFQSYRDRIGKFMAHDLHGLQGDMEKQQVDSDLNTVEKLPSASVEMGLADGGEVSPETGLPEQDDKPDKDASTDDYNDVPGVGYVPTIKPNLGPSWMEQAKAQTEKDIENYQKSGVKGLMADTEGTQDLAGGFAGSTTPAAKGVGALAKVGRDALYDLAPAKVDTFQKITNKLGTHPGGVFSDPANGERWYVKNTPSWDHAKNEKLAAELYKLAGVPTADVRLTTLNGKPAIASKWIQGEELNKFEGHPSTLSDLHEGLPADVWTGNYDSIGTGKNNVVIDEQGKAHRIDLGGALRYRAQGSPKANWGSKVTEHESMTIPGFKGINNTDATDIFNPKNYGSMSQAALAIYNKLGAQRVAKISDEQIAGLVNKYGPDSGKNKLINELADRRDQVAKIYDAQPKPTLSVIEGGGSTGGLQKYAGDQEFVPYKNASAREDAATMMDNHKYSGTNEYDVPGMANDIYRMASSGYSDFAKKVQYYLPSEVSKELDKNINKLVKDSGYDPWKSTEINPTPAMKPAAELQQLKPMQLNKAHHTPDFVNGLKDHSAIGADPKIITTKQQTKIKEMMDNHNSDDVADAIYNGPYSQKQKNNILSWMNPKKKSEIEHVLNNPKGLSKDELDQLEYEMKQNQQVVNEANIHAGGEFTGQQYKAQTGKEFKKKGNPYADLMQIKDAKWFQQWKPLEKKQFPAPEFGPSLKEKVKILGFNPEAIFGHGSTYHYPTGYPEQLKPATHKSYESGFFTGIDPEVPKGYGSNVQTYIGRPQKIGVIDWHDLRLHMEGVPDKFGYTGHHMDPLIDAGHKLGVDLLIINRIRDIAQYGNKLQTQYVFLNPAVLRAPTAKFDPAKLHLAHPLAGVVGGGLFSYGMLRGQEGEQPQMATGGRVCHSSNPDLGKLSARILRKCKLPDIPTTKRSLPR